MMDDGKPWKVVMLGNTGVGKSNLLSRFLSKEFSEDSQSTIGVEFLTKTMEVDGVTVTLQIWDTAGQEKYASLMKTYFRRAKGSLLVYDVTNPTSLTGLEVWRTHLERFADPLCVAVVTGNKSDLSPQSPTADQAEVYATERNLLHIQTSAKSGDNVEEAFIMLAKNILAARQDGRDAAEGGSMKLQSKSPSNSAQDCC